MEGGYLNEYDGRTSVVDHQHNHQTIKSTVTSQQQLIERPSGARAKDQSLQEPPLRHPASPKSETSTQLNPPAGLRSPGPEDIALSPSAPPGANSASGTAPPNPAHGGQASSSVAGSERQPASVQGNPTANNFMHMQASPPMAPMPHSRRQQKQPFAQHAGRGMSPILDHYPHRGSLSAGRSQFLGAGAPVQSRMGRQGGFSAPHHQPFHHQFQSSPPPPMMGGPMDDMAGSTVSHPSAAALSGQIPPYLLDEQFPSLSPEMGGHFPGPEAIDMYGLDPDFMLPNSAASFAVRNGFMPHLMEDEHLTRQSLSGLDRQFHPSPAAFNNQPPMTLPTQEDNVSYLRREQFRLELMMRKLLKDHQALSSFYPGRSNNIPVHNERSSAYGLNPLAASFSRQSHLSPRSPIEQKSRNFASAGFPGASTGRASSDRSSIHDRSSIPTNSSAGSGDRGAPSLYHCKICDKLMNSRTSYESHLNGKPHKMRLLSLRTRNGQRGGNLDGAQHGNQGGSIGGDRPLTTCQIIGGVNPSALQGYEEKGHSAAAKNPPQSKLPGQNGGVYQCDVCNIWVSSAVNLRDHLAGSKHRKRVLARQNSKHPASNLRSGCAECASGKMWLCDACGNANYEWRKRCNMNFCREPKRADHGHCDPADAKVIVRKSVSKPVKKYQVVTCKPGSLGANGKWNSGRIVEVKPGGQLKALGVRVGWVIEKINELPYTEDKLDAVLGGAKEFCLTFRVPSTAPGAGKRNMPSFSNIVNKAQQDAKARRMAGKPAKPNTPTLLRARMSNHNSGARNMMGGTGDTQCNLWSDLCHATVPSQKREANTVSLQSTSGLDEGRGRNLEKLSSASGSTSPPPPASVRSESFMFNMNSSTAATSSKAPAKQPAPTNSDVDRVTSTLSQWAQRMNNLTSPTSPGAPQAIQLRGGLGKPRRSAPGASSPPSSASNNGSAASMSSHNAHQSGQQGLRAASKQQARDQQQREMVTVASLLAELERRDDEARPGSKSPQGKDGSKQSNPMSGRRKSRKAGSVTSSAASSGNSNQTGRAPMSCTGSAPAAHGSSSNGSTKAKSTSPSSPPPEKAKSTSPSSPPIEVGPNHFDEGRVTETAECTSEQRTQQRKANSEDFFRMNPPAELEESIIKNMSKLSEKKFLSKSEHERLVSLQKSNAPIQNVTDCSQQSANVSEGY